MKDGDRPGKRQAREEPTSKHQNQPGHREWAGWRGTGQAGPVSRDHTLWRERDRENQFSPCSADHNVTRLVPKVLHS